MASDEQLRQRTKPDDSEEESDEDLTTFTGNAKGKFRSRVREYKDQTEFPAVPLYSVGETVYLALSGKAPAGPYVVVAISAQRYYTIKRADNGQLLSDAVDESMLLVRTS
ncbi:hypothetical protein F4803DRAFT_22286 [Xylaria telfairii]|nr:hypothetical protein F4803DRAFT_22286 [Xylaria telfairii]